MKLIHRSVIGPEENPLLIRYRIFRFRRFGVFLHHILRSDHERALHDHPWNFVSIILSGSYIEWTPQGPREFNRWSVLVRPAFWLHRLELSQPAWTLVLVGRHFREWGFLLGDRWCWWRRYDVLTGGCSDDLVYPVRRDS